MSQSLSLTRINPITTAPRWPLIAGAIMAVLAHALVIGFIYYFSLNWRPLLDVAEDTPPSVPVDLVTIADKTNIAPTVTRAPPPKPVEATPPPQPVPPPPTPTPQADDVAEPAPVPSQPVVPKPAPPPKPIAKPQPAPATPPTPPKEAKKPKVESFAALLNNIPSQAPPPHKGRIADRDVKGVGDMNAQTADIADALRSQIKPCWSPPVGAPHPEELVVDFDLFLGPDGSVAQPPQLTADSQSRMGDPYTRAAAEAARRAIYTCAPYKNLPRDRYSQWREINPFHFDPRQMMGQ
jgi:outer membrane biosynthesis protein TonB